MQKRSEDNSEREEESNCDCEAEENDETFEAEEHDLETVEAQATQVLEHLAKARSREEGLKVIKQAQSTMTGRMAKEALAMLANEYDKFCSRTELGA